MKEAFFFLFVCFAFSSGLVNSRLKSYSSSGVSLGRLWAGFGKRDKKPKGSGFGKRSADDSEQYFLEPKPEVYKKSVPVHIPNVDLKYPNLKALFGDPPVITVDDFLTKDICESYIKRAQVKGVQINSQTFSSSSASTRTSTTWYMNYQDVPELIHYASKLTGVSPLHFEEPQIVRYEIGQQFSWHYDAIPPSMNNNGGNRLGTLIVYLNTLPAISGGATCFKDLKVQVKPDQGKALLFFPCYKDGSVDERTMHCGQVSDKSIFGGV